MDPSIYQQQREQQNRVLYPFPVNQQGGSATNMSASGYPQQYMANFTNNTAYVGTGNGINSMMQLPANRAIFPAPVGAPVGTMTSITANGMPPAKRVALAPPATQMRSMYQNMTSSSAQNQLYGASGGFTNQVFRPSVPTQHFMNQNIDVKSAAAIQTNPYAPMENMSKYYGQYQHTAQKSTIEINNLLNQTSSSQAVQQQQQQQQNQTSQNLIQQQDDNDMSWLEMDDPTNTLYDFGFGESDVDLTSTTSSSIGPSIQGWNSSSIQGNVNYIASDTPKSYASMHQGQQQEQLIPSQQQSEQNSSSIQGDLNYMAQDTSKTYATINNNHQEPSNLPQQEQQQKPTKMLHQHQPQPQIEQENPSFTYSQSVQSAIIGQDMLAQKRNTVSSIHSSPSPVMHVLPNETSTLPAIYGNQNQTANINKNLRTQARQLVTPSEQMPSQNSTIAVYSQQSSLQNKNEQKPRINLQQTQQQQQQQQQHQQQQQQQRQQQTPPPSQQLPTSPYSYSNTTNSSKSISSDLQQTNSLQSDPLRKSPRLSEVDSKSNNATPQSMPSQTSPNVMATPSTSTSGPSAKKQPQKPPKITYLPKTRNIETYGGIDLRVFERFSIPLNVPSIYDLGAVDIHALTMSLKSGMKLEVANALNSLTTVSSQRNLMVDLRLCGDLLDVLFDMVSEYIEGEKIEDNVQSERRFKSYRELFELSKEECLDFLETVPNVSDGWLSSREKCWCVVNLIRNFSFMGENNQYLATHPRLLPVLMRTLYIGQDTGGSNEGEDYVVVGGDDLFNDQQEMEEKRIKKGMVGRMRAIDILDHRKTVLIILSNITAYLPLPSVSVSRDLLVVLCDFLDYTGDYYAHIALEVLAKISVAYENRQKISGCPEATVMTVFERLVRMLPRTEKIDPMQAYHDLAHLETVVMALYNFVCLSNETLRRRMVNTAGFVHQMLKMSLSLSVTYDGTLVYDQTFTPLCRRAMETLKLLAKGNESVFLVYTEHLMRALQTPYIDPVVVRDLESIMYPGDV